jgi:hypothetical protein
LTAPDTHDVPPKRVRKKIKRTVLRWSREPATRLQVFAIWAFVAMLLAITRNAAAWHIFEISSASALAFFLWPFVDGPFLLHARSTLPLRADYRPISNPAEIAYLGLDIPTRRVSELQKMGFHSAGQLLREPEGRNAVSHLEMFIHPENKDSAQLAQHITGLRRNYLLIFKSRFEDGFAFETSNNHTAPIFDPDPNFPVFRFPAVRLTGDLYRLHCKIKERFLDTHRPAIGESQGELAEFITRAEIIHERFAVQSGDYQLSPSGDRYIYSWKGAIRHAWLMAWPIKQLRRLRLRNQGMKMAEELGFRINPKFGSLETLNPHSKATI